jgi:hypothetical protein
VTSAELIRLDTMSTNSTEFEVPNEAREDVGIGFVL